MAAFVGGCAVSATRGGFVQTCSRAGIAAPRWAGRRVARRRCGAVVRAVQVEEFNPSKGSDAAANTAFINVSDTAKKHLESMRAQDSGRSTLRIGVRQGGCSGLSYFMNVEEEGNVSDADEVLEVMDGVRVVCDVKSLMYLYGMTLDFSTDLVGGGFKFFNPKASSTCGCGQSFGV